MIVAKQEGNSVLLLRSRFGNRDAAVAAYVTIKRAGLPYYRSSGSSPRRSAIRSVKE